MVGHKIHGSHHEKLCMTWKNDPSVVNILSKWHWDCEIWLFSKKTMQSLAQFFAMIWACHFKFVTFHPAWQMECLCSNSQSHAFEGAQKSQSLPSQQLVSHESGEKNDTITWWGQHWNLTGLLHTLQCMKACASKCSMFLDGPFRGREEVEGNGWDAHCDFLWSWSLFVCLFAMLVVHENKCPDPVQLQHVAAA